MAIKDLSRTNELLPALFNDFFKPWNEWYGDSGFTGRLLTVPAVNVSENKDNFIIELAAPGLTRNDFNIHIDDTILTINSEIEDKKEEKDSRFTRKEYNYASFSRSFTLPDEVNQEKIEAAYKNGVLQVTLPKKEETKKAQLSRNISVQ